MQVYAGKIQPRYSAPKTFLKKCPTRPKNPGFFFAGALAGAAGWVAFAAGAGSGAFVGSTCGGAGAAYTRGSFNACGGGCGFCAVAAPVCGAGAGFSRGARPAL